MRPTNTAVDGVWSSAATTVSSVAAAVVTVAAAVVTAAAAVVTAATVVEAAVDDAPTTEVVIAWADERSVPNIVITTPLPVDCTVEA